VVHIFQAKLNDEMKQVVVFQKLANDRKQHE
jgi:hypothetical protein